jgi:hypothetical protein
MRIPATILLFACAAFAQEEKVAIRGLSLAEGNFPKLWVSQKQIPVALTFSPFQPTPPIPADKTDPLLVFSGALDPEGKPEDKNPAKVKLPPGSSFLLLGWMVENKPAFLAIEDPFETSKSDDWMLINTTSKTVAIQIGEKTKPVPLKPGEHTKMKITAPSGTGAATTMAYAEGKDWKPFYSSYVPIFNDKRCIVIIARSGEDFRVKIIPDKPVLVTEKK